MSQLNGETSLALTKFKSCDCMISSFYAKDKDPINRLNSYEFSYKKTI